jgi:hypothetical protein
MPPFPTEDADVRQAYAEHLLREAITYAVEQAKMKPDAVSVVITDSLRRFKNPHPLAGQKPGPFGTNPIKEPTNG